MQLKWLLLIYFTLHVKAICIYKSAIFASIWTCSDLNSSNYIIEDDLRNYYSRNKKCELHIINSSITDLKATTFSRIKHSNIYSLHMKEIKIETIEIGAFSALNELTQIDLKSNELRVLSKGCFNSLIKLSMLDLSYNKISTIEADVFSECETLRSVYLNNNNITHLPKDLFYLLKKLNFLNLSNNRMAIFDLKFTNTAKSRITLKNNSFHTFNPVMDENSFYSIDLRNNNLLEFNAACLPNATEEVYLGGNHIRTIHNFRNLSKIRDLDLSENNFTRIEVGEFKGLNTLLTLQLQKNSLTEITPGLFKDLSSLKTLNLSNNGLYHLNYGVFNGLENLVTLDVGYNKLEIFEEDVLHNLRNLMNFNIRHNYIEYLNLVKMKTYSPLLREVDVIGNDISCQKLVSMFSYSNKLHVNIATNVHYELPNVKGVPCNNPNTPNTTVDVRISTNVFKEMQMFFNNNFENTTFYKFFEHPTTQINSIFSIFIIISNLLLCLLVIIVIIQLSKIQKRRIHYTNPELSLL